MQTGNHVVLEGTASHYTGARFYFLGVCLGVAAVALPNISIEARLGTAGLGFLFALMGYWRVKSLRYLVTEKYIELHQGVLSHDISDVPFHQVAQVKSHQSAFMHLMNVGDVELLLDGRLPIRLPTAPNPGKLRELLRELVESRKEQLMQRPRGGYPLRPEPPLLT